MIVDKLENIENYEVIPDCIKKFIKNIPNECGRYQICDSAYVNVEAYNTKKPEDCFFETHKKYADIQIILKGTERIDYTDSSDLKVKEPYNEDRDIAFWYNSKKELASVFLDGTNFVILFPDEAHRPQMNYCDKSQTVLKAVVKIEM